jgi:hypothetical protein
MEVLTVIAAALALTGREAAKTVVSEGVKIGDHRERQYSDLGAFFLDFRNCAARPSPPRGQSGNRAIGSLGALVS